MSDTPAAETPWDVVKRMRAEGQPREVIVARLATMGLSKEDANVLLLEDPPKADGGLEVGTAAAAVAIIAAGPILGGLAVAAMSERVAEREAPAPQAPLSETDTTTNRCAQHPQLAAVATCSRCGAFACRECAPKDESLCASCEAQPAVREERVRAFARRAGYMTFSFVGLLLVEVLFTADSSVARGVLVIVGAIALPFVVLGTTQLFVRSGAPAILAIVYASGLLLVVVATGPDILTLPWLVCTVVLGFMVSGLGSARRAAVAKPPAVK